MEYDSDPNRPSSRNIFKRIGKWLLPAILASSIIGSYQFSIWKQVQESKSPKSDEEKIWPYFEMGGAEQNTFKLDEQIDGFDRSIVDFFPKPSTYDLDENIATGAICRVYGKIDFTNWGTTFELSLHDASNPSADDLKIWSWEARNGVSVSFSRYFANSLSHTAKLRLKIWNESHETAGVKGPVTFKCDTSADE